MSFVDGRVNVSINYILGARFGSRRLSVRHRVSHYATTGVPRDWLAASSRWRNDGENVGVSIQKFGYGASEKRLQLIEKQLRANPRFASVKDFTAAAHRVAGLNDPDQFRRITHDLYRVYHQKQSNYRAEGSPKAKLNWVKVRQIRASWPNKSQACLAREFGVSQPTIAQILHRATWREPSQ